MAGAELLRQAMASRGVAQVDLERQRGVAGGSVSRWLRGERSPSLASALALEDLLGVPARSWVEAES